MTDEPNQPFDETAHEMPESSIGILQRGQASVYIVPGTDTESHNPHLVIAYPFEDGALLTASNPELPAETATLNVEYGAYRTFSLADVARFRDDHERIRDQMRHGKRDEPAQEQKSDLIGLQELIDIFVIVERAVEFTETSENPERSRHYRRISALCDDPQEVIENVGRALGHQPEPSGMFDRLRTAVGREGTGNP